MNKGYIQEKLPDLQIRTMEQNMNGQNNAVFLVNEELVFRFPKYGQGLQQLRQETVLLLQIQQRVPLPLPVPEPLYVFLDEAPGRAFVGYRLLSGRPLWRKDFAAVKEKGRLAQQLAEFLQALHRLPAAEFSYLRDAAQDMAHLYERTQQKLFSFMRPDAREAVAQLFSSGTASYTTAVIHGDFGASNILYDKQSISGIIDFGGAALGDPAYDFAGLLACYGEDFLQECLQHYQEGDQLLPRIRFYRETFALQEALHGMENGDEEAFQSGIQGYV
ncbi:phosphotransferase family protein [Ectobacillus ponti]|uniref:Aminoglycoside phosphotransferase family protein n=1 Tax=Ectobacillus ponti TaxID=2961894 RepID=A0AA42BN73_9BACI|nr:phosphotransferase [Ectobacillus ponti]MCP8967660.1 aminoglycoside phosphotransferase family protein [Ectobacillus ponti]